MQASVEKEIGHQVVSLTDCRGSTCLMSRNCRRRSPVTAQETGLPQGSNESDVEVDQHQLAQRLGQCGENNFILKNLNDEVDDEKVWEARPKEIQSEVLNDDDIQKISHRHQHQRVIL